MWQRFTEGTKNAIFRAQRAAKDRSENLVKPEHLLIGLLADTDTVAYRLLQESGVPVGDLMRHLEDILTPGPGRDDSDLRLDSAARKAIDLAWNEARRLRRNYIGTEHLILGILAADSGATGITFRHFALDLQKGRSLIDTAGQSYPALSQDAGPVLVVAAPLTELGTEEIARRRKELLPMLFLGILFAVLVVMLRGCG